MIGKEFRYPLSGHTGVVDMIRPHPDGRKLARINDHWFFADELRPAG